MTYKYISHTKSLDVKRPSHECILIKNHLRRAHKDETWIYTCSNTHLQIGYQQPSSTMETEGDPYMTYKICMVWMHIENKMPYIS